MYRKAKFLAHGALIAALYVVLTYLQNFIFPDSGSFSIQFRAAEALCVLALFTRAAIPGLTIGCLLFNISYAGALPLDFLIGTLATLLAASTMRLIRHIRIKGYPLPALLSPAVFNAVLVGWELDHYIGGGFWFNFVCVFIGEAVVLLTLGSLVYHIIRVRKLDYRLFG